MSSVEPSRASNILVVEEYDGWRGAVAGILEYLGYRVWTAGRGREALELGRRCRVRFDLLVTTLHLKDMTGRELCRRLHALQSGVRVVYTCWPDDTGKSHHMLHKPFSVKHLELVVRRALWPRGEGAEPVRDDGVLAARGHESSRASQH